MNCLTIFGSKVSQKFGLKASSKDKNSLEKRLLKLIEFVRKIYFTHIIFLLWISVIFISFGFDSGSKYFSEYGFMNGHFSRKT